MNAGGAAAGDAENNLGCSICKHRRIRCEENCEYVKYFPMSMYDDFRKAWKLFGLNNIVKMISSVDPPTRPVAAEAILYQAKLRDIDPVHGCLGYIKSLQSKVKMYEDELERVNELIQACKEANVAKDEYLQLRGLLMDDASDLNNDNSIPLPPSRVGVCEDVTAENINKGASSSMTIQPPSNANESQDTTTT